MKKLKYMATLSIITVMAVGMLTGCGTKNIDKMTDQELYNYMSSEFDSMDDLDTWAENLTEEQQERVVGVMFTYGLMDMASEE